MNAKTVFLDAGGVILDEQGMEQAMAEVAAEVLSEIVRDYSQDSYWRDVEEAASVYAPRIYQYVFWKHMKHMGVAFDEAYEDIISRWRERKPPLELMSGIDREIRSLRHDFDLGILGQYGREVLDLLESESLLDCFRYTYTQDDFSITKPDPRYYEQVLEACEVKPSECIMVGDRIDKDVVPARQVGMKIIRIRVGILSQQEPRIPFEVPDIELRSVEGLAEAARSLAGIASRR